MGAKKNKNRGNKNASDLTKSTSNLSRKNSNASTKMNGVVAEINNNKLAPVVKAAPHQQLEWSWTAERTRPAVAKIFSFLSKEDKHAISLVCKDWKKLMTEPEFAGTLYIRDCVIDRAEPPLSLLKSSSTKFRNLEFGRNVKWTDATEANRLAKQIGYSVSKIRFNEVKSHLNFAATQGFLQLFKHLKEMHVQLLSDLVHMEVGDSVTTIHVSAFYNAMPSSQLKMLQGWKGKKTLTASRFYNSACGNDTTRQTQQFLKLGGALEKLLEEQKLTEFSTKSNLLGVDEIDVSDIEFMDYKFKLCLDDDKKVVFSCTSLAKLCIQVDRSTGCFFYHDAVKSLSAMREVCLVLGPGSDHCSICSRCLAKLHESCPGVDTWTINGKIRNYQEVITGARKPIRGLTIMNIDEHLKLSGFESHIEHLTIQPFSTFLHFDFMFDLERCNWAAMPKLRNLCLGDGVHFNIAGLESFSKKCPRLETFRINGPFQRPDYLPVLAKEFSQLKRVEACFAFADYKQVAQDTLGTMCEVVHRM